MQNSLDAGAKRITIQRLRLKGTVNIVVRDDGEGVLPEMEREQALEYLATHVGHSRKLDIDPLERQRRVIAGQYGVGILGFWAVGRLLELRTRIAGSPLWALRLEEDKPSASIQVVPLRTDDPETFTEVVVGPLHPAAEKPLGGRRLCDYLAAELRGQLLRSGVEIEIHDRVARGTAQKQFRVTPLRFSGEGLALPAELEVPGFPPLRVELYLARGAERPAIQVAAAGTLVADDIAELTALGLGEPPWVGRELVGILDFAGFQVPPGSRRGVSPDAGSEAFLDAMSRLRPLVESRLAELDRQREAARDRDVVKDLRRALRGIRRRLPQYDLPRVEGKGRENGDPGKGEGIREPAGEPSVRAAAAAPTLFPPGPLRSLRIVPGEVKVAAGGERRVRAVSADAEGREPDGVELRWWLEGGEGTVAIRGEGPRPAVAADPRAREGTRVTLVVEAMQGELRARARAEVEVAVPEEDQGMLGIPEPHLVSDAEGPWRSRLHGDLWEVNDAHEDYRALRAEPRARVRYLLALLAREIVLKNFGRPEDGPALEAMVEILAHAERNLRGS